MSPAPLQNLRIPEPILEVIRVLQAAGHQAFLVGGCVRDALRGLAPKDWDVATSARPEQVQSAFKKVIPTGVQHGTVTVLSKGSSVEVTTFRSEGAYLDGRRPSTVQFETNIDADLSRRDFTMNALAFDPISAELRDPFAGQADIVARMIRCVGDPAARFGEDGLRPMRALRFAAVLGFEIDPSTLAAIGPALPSFRKVSMERIREELTKLLTSARPGPALELLRSTGMLEVFLPELAQVPAEQWRRTLAVIARLPTGEALRLSGLLRGIGSDPKALVLRLKYPNKTADAVALWLGSLPALEKAATWSDADARRFLAAIRPENLEPILALAEAELGGALEQTRAHLQRVLGQHPVLDAKQLALKGQEIMAALSAGPSPLIGEATRFLFERVLDDPTANTAERLRELLSDWHRSQSKP